MERCREEKNILLLDFVWEQKCNSPLNSLLQRAEENVFSSKDWRMKHPFLLRNQIFIIKISINHLTIVFYLKKIIKWFSPT